MLIARKVATNAQVTVVVHHQTQAATTAVET